jgi:hypothetical protein
MEVKNFSETYAGFQRNTRRYISEDRTLHNHSCENLKSYTDIKMNKTSHIRVYMYISKD